MLGMSLECFVRLPVDVFYTIAVLFNNCIDQLLLSIDPTGSENQYSGVRVRVML